MPAILDIEGTEYTLVGVQRGGLAVYRGSNGYLRLGDEISVARDVASHREMEQAGYPIARIIAEGEMLEGSYYIETSQGDISFRNLFSAEIQSDGEISDSTFKTFLEIVERYLSRQVSTRRVTDGADFRARVKLDALCAEMPQQAEELTAQFEQTVEALSAMPYVLSHGDFNAANLYERGVIDLEDTLSAPFGYDAVTALCTVDWIPPEGNYEYTRSYTFTRAQKEEYMALVDTVTLRNGIPPVSYSYQSLEFLRAIWMVSDLQKWPRARAYMHKQFMNKYLAK